MYYRHYKGGVYEVLGVGVHSETNEQLVVYRSLRDNVIWLRPKEMFYGELEVDGKKIHRFEKMEDDSTGSLPRC